MKCKNCGAELNLEDPYCRYCGAPNEFAQQHIRDMEHYQKEFEQTKKDVYSKTGSYVGITSRIIVLVVIIALILGSVILTNNSYMLYSWNQKRIADKNYKKFSQQLDSYLENGEYEKIHAFAEYYRIYSYDDGKYEKYNNVISAANHYYYIMDDCRQIATEVEGSEAAYRSLASSVNSFIRYDIPDSSSNSYKVYTDEDTAYILDMYENIKAMLVTYVGVTDEEAESLLELSERKRTILIEGIYYDTVE